MSFKERRYFSNLFALDSRYKIDVDDDQFTVNPRLLNKVEARPSIIPPGQGGFSEDEEGPPATDKSSHEKEVRAASADKQLTRSYSTQNYSINVFL